jgi:hypothetical protein
MDPDHVKTSRQRSEPTMDAMAITGSRGISIIWHWPDLTFLSETSIRVYIVNISQYFLFK